MAHRWISNLNSLSTKNSCFHLHRLMLLDCFENFAIRKRECHLCFASVSTNRQALIYNPRNGNKKEKAHEEGRPCRLSHSLQQNCSLEKLMRSTMRMYNLTDIWIHVVEPRYNSYVTKDMDPASITNHILRPSQNRKSNYGTIRPPYWRTQI